MPPARPLKIRFDEKVLKPEDSAGCWLWSGSDSGGGYGRIWFGSTHIGAHRAAWICYRGDIPEDKHVLHICNNGAGGCVNPDHLYVGTDKENTKDKVLAGNNGMQKLTIADLPDIRARLVVGESQAAIARDYKVSQATISRINTDKTFKNM